jgi:hypothetical protein
VVEANRWTTAAGFAGALIVLAALIWLVGITEILRSLSRADLPVVVAVVVVSVVWLSSWGMSLHTVLEVLGANISPVKSILVFAGAMFSNNVTPFGQAGGEPVTALLISRATDSEYETGLAAIASVDALHFLPSIGFATIGLGVLAVRAVTLGRNIYIAVAAIAGLTALFLLAAYLGWRYRYEIERVVVRIVTPIIQRIGRLLPGRRVPTRATLESRIERFFTSIDRVTGSRRALLTASLFSAFGWFSLSIALWLSLYSLGASVSIIAVFIAIPVASIAGVTPLPGGSGAVESVLVVLLVSTTGISGPVATAGVFIYRGATYWLPIFVGGGVVAAVGAEETLT